MWSHDSHISFDPKWDILCILPGPYQHFEDYEKNAVSNFEEIEKNLIKNFEETEMYAIFALLE